MKNLIILLVVAGLLSCKKEIKMPDTPTKVTIAVAPVNNQWEATATLSQQVPSVVRVVFTFDEGNGLRRSIKSSIDLSSGELRRTDAILSTNGASASTNLKIISVEAQGYNNFNY